MSAQVRKNRSRAVVLYFRNLINSYCLRFIKLGIGGRKCTPQPRSTKRASASLHAFPLS